jgi:outer membrane protein assembly factor BamE (lipoprotein component of BamABCDE complex)
MLIFKNFSYKLLVLLNLFVISCFIASCSGKNLGKNCQDRGYNFTLGNKDLLVNNLFTKEKVLEYMGHPTFTDSFSQQEKWIYREEKVCRFLFLPKRVEQDKILILAFENDLMVDSSFYDNIKSKKHYFETKSKTTEIPEVNKSDWLRDIIGNIGKVTPF